MNNLFKKLLWLLLAATMLMGVVSCSDDDDDDDDNPIKIKTAITSVTAGTATDVEFTNLAADKKVKVTVKSKDGTTTVINAQEYTVDANKKISITIPTTTANGKYRITFSCSGYESVTKEFDLTGGASTETFTADTKLIGGIDGVKTLSNLGLATITTVTQSPADSLTIGEVDNNKFTITSKSGKTGSVTLTIAGKITSDAAAVAKTPATLTVSVAASGAITVGAVTVASDKEQLVAPVLTYTAANNKDGLITIINYSADVDYEVRVGGTAMGTQPRITAGSPATTATFTVTPGDAEQVVTVVAKPKTGDSTHSASVPSNAVTVVEAEAPEAQPLTATLKVDSGKLKLDTIDLGAFTGTLGASAAATVYTPSQWAGSGVTVELATDKTNEYTVTYDESANTQEAGSKDPGFTLANAGDLVTSYYIHIKKNTAGTAIELDATKDNGCKKETYALLKITGTDSKKISLGGASADDVAAGSGIEGFDATASDKAYAIASDAGQQGKSIKDSEENEIAWVQFDTDHYKVTLKAAGKGTLTLTSGASGSTIDTNLTLIVAEGASSAKLIAAHEKVRGTTGVIDDFFGYPLDSAQLQESDVVVDSTGKVYGTLKKASFAGLKTLKGADGADGEWDVFLTNHDGVNEQSGYYICLDTKTKTDGTNKTWENAFCFFLGADATTAKAKTITKTIDDTSVTLNFTNVTCTGDAAAQVVYDESKDYRATTGVIDDFFGYSCDSAQFAGKTVTKDGKSVYENDVKIYSNGVVKGTFKKVDFAGLKTLTGADGKPGSYDIFLTSNPNNNNANEQTGYYLCLDKKNGENWENAYCFFVSADGSTFAPHKVAVGDEKLDLVFKYATYEALAVGTTTPKVAFGAATLPKADGTNDITVTNAGAEEDLLSKTIGDLVDGELTFTVDKGSDGHDVIKVSGTLKKIESAWTQFGGSDNTGYFVPLWYTANGNTKIVFLDNDKKAKTGPGSKSIDLTATKGDGQIIRVTSSDGNSVDTSKKFLIGFGTVSDDTAYTNYATLDFSGCTAQAAAGASGR